MWYIPPDEWNRDADTLLIPVYWQERRAIKKHTAYENKINLMISDTAEFILFFIIPAKSLISVFLMLKAIKQIQHAILKQSINWNVND